MSMRFGIVNPFRNAGLGSHEFLVCFGGIVVLCHSERKEEMTEFEPKGKTKKKKNDF